MTITPYTLNGLNLHSYGPPRTSGLHLSTILRYIARSHGILDKEWYGTISLTELVKRTPVSEAGKVGILVKIAMGYAWERFMQEMVDGPIYQPGETTCEKVIGTPDGAEVEKETGRTIIHEFKLTWYSSAKSLEEQHLWMWQTMALCFMLSQEMGELVDTAIVHPVYLAGDYRANREPVYLPQRVKFEEKEMETNWNMVRNNKNNVMPEVW